MQAKPLATKGERTSEIAAAVQAGEADILSLCLTSGGLYSFELSAVKATVAILSCYDLFAVNVFHIAVKALCAL